jgi:excisionase family DNA binding protein
MNHAVGAFSQGFKEKSSSQFEGQEHLQAQESQASELFVPPRGRPVNVRELASYLRCSVSTVERLTREGAIPSFKVGRLRRYAISEVLVALGAKER